MFQLENEEMSFDNMFVDYSKVKEFYDEHNEIDVKMKGDSFTTLTPPPQSNVHRKERGMSVFVTEINADFCCNDITPLTVQDPVWGVICHQVKLDQLLLSLMGEENQIAWEMIQYRWKRNCLLNNLRSITMG